MNREQKRRYWKMAAKEKGATMCPFCKHKTIKKYDVSQEAEFAGYIICECCGNILFKIPVEKNEDGEVTADINNESTVTE